MIIFYRKWLKRKKFIEKKLLWVIVVIYRPMSPIGSESVSIQEHINVLEAHSLSYRSCASQLLCAILFGHICSQSIECEQTMIDFCWFFRPEMVSIMRERKTRIIIFFSKSIRLRRASVSSWLASSFVTNLKKCCLRQAKVIGLASASAYGGFASAEIMTSWRK